MIGDPPETAWAAKWLGISESAVAAMPRDVVLAAAQSRVAPPPAWLRQALAEIGPGSPGEAIRLWRLLVCLYPALRRDADDPAPEAGGEG